MQEYGDIVRVVTIDPEYSVELCGGTHVGATGELGFFKIISETAIAAGVRRMEAVSGNSADQYIDGQLQQLDQVKQALKNPKDLLKAISTLNEEHTGLKKQLEKLELVQLKGMSEDLVRNAEKVNGVNFVGQVVEVSSADALKKLASEIRQKLPSHIIALASAIDGKASVVLQFDEKAGQEKGLDASALIKQKIAPLIKGGGGGQKTLATAGGQDISALHQVIETVKSLL